MAGQGQLCRVPRVAPGLLLCFPGNRGSSRLDLGLPSELKGLESKRFVSSAHETGGCLQVRRPLVSAEVTQRKAFRLGFRLFSQSNGSRLCTTCPAARVGLPVPSQVEQEVLTEQMKGSSPPLGPAVPACTVPLGTPASAPGVRRAVNLVSLYQLQPDPKCPAAVSNALEQRTSSRHRLMRTRKISEY